MIIQIHTETGQVVGTYNNISSAAKGANVDMSNLSKLLNGTVGKMLNKYESLNGYYFIHISDHIYSITLNPTIEKLAKKIIEERKKTFNERFKELLFST